MTETPEARKERTEGAHVYALLELGDAKRAVQAALYVEAEAEKRVQRTRAEYADAWEAARVAAEQVTA